MISFSRAAGLHEDTATSEVRKLGLAENVVFYVKFNRMIEGFGKKVW